MTIRKFPKYPLTVEDLHQVRHGRRRRWWSSCGACVEARLNILVSGGTGSGKTTLLNVLSGFIPSDERIVTIEDAAELQLAQDHVVRLETRPPNIEGKGEVTITRSRQQLPAYAARPHRRRRDAAAARRSTCSRP